MSNYQKKPVKKSDKLTTSHIMLFIILLVYFIVAIFGMSIILVFLSQQMWDIASNSFIALCSYATVCGTSTIVVYCKKAEKENEIKISNLKYQLKIEMAKEIYQSVRADTLDDKSIILLKTLLDEQEDLNNFLQNCSQNNNSDDTIVISNENYG